MDVWVGVYIWACIYELCFLCAGESGANPVCAEFHRGGSSPADCFGRLSQPTHGESPTALCKRRKVFKSRTHLTSGELCVSLSQDYVQALTGLCYDGVEGLIYLVLFSFVTALMFSSIVCSVPHTWPGKRWHTQTHTYTHRQTNTCQGTFTNTDKTYLSLYILKSISFINQCTNK